MDIQKLIYCQRDIPKKKWRYGFRSSAAVGCGWIAAYNALCIMGCHPSAEKIIRSYEKMFPLIHGNLGTFLFAPVIYFKFHGFSVTWTVKRNCFDEIAKQSDACILYFRWRNKWKFGAHFVALHYTNDVFIGYNTYTNSKGEDNYGKSLDGFLKQKKYFAAVLIGISNTT